MKNRARLWLLPAFSIVLPALLPDSSFGDQLLLSPPTPGGSQFVINDPNVWYSQTFLMTVAPTSADDLEVNASSLIASGSAPPIVLLLDDYQQRSFVNTLQYQSLTIDAAQGLSIARNGTADVQLILGDSSAPTSLLYIQNAPVNLSANVAVQGIASLTDQLTLQQSASSELTAFNAFGLQIAGGNPAPGVFTNGSLVVNANTYVDIGGTVNIFDNAGANVIGVSGSPTALGTFIASAITSQAISAQTLLNVGPYGSVQINGPIASSNSVGAVLNATDGTVILSDISLQDIGGTMISAAGSANVTAGTTTFNGTAGGTLFAASGSAIISAHDVTGTLSSHLVGPVVDAMDQSAVTLGNVTVQDADTVLLRLTSLGQVSIGDLTINGTLAGEVVNASQGAQVKVGSTNIGLGAQLLGSLVIAKDFGTYVQFGNVGDFVHVGGFTVLPSFSATVVSVTGGAYVVGGLLDLGSVDTPQGIVVDGAGSTLILDGLSIPSATGTSIVVSAGGNLSIGKDGVPPDWGTLTHSVYTGEEGALQISVTGNSILNTPAGMEIHALHPSTLTVDDSQWNGASNYSYDFQSQGGANNVNLVVQNSSTLNNLSLYLWYGVTATFDHSTLNNTSMSIQFGSQATVSNTIWKTNQVINVGDNSTNGGTYGGNGTLNVSNSQLYDLIFFMASNAGGVAQITLDTRTIANTGEIQASVSSKASGTSTLTVRGGSQLWTYTSLDLGASKRPPNFGVWPVVTESTGTAHLVIQNTSQVVVGGAVRSDGTFSNFTTDVSVTLGAGSDISIDSRSFMYVGRISAASQAIFNDGALTLGNAGWIFGNGTINGNLINGPIVAGTVLAGGTISPGLSPGHLTVNGSYVQNSGELDIEIGGPNAGQFDELTASSFDFLGGKVVLSLYGSGYTGTDLAGQTLTFFTGGPVNWSGAQFIDQTGFGLQLTDGSVTFPGTPVPEPASLAVLGLGLAALLRRRRK